MKKIILQIIHILAMSAFVGISAYGVIIILLADELENPMSAGKSILLGLTAFACMAVIVIIGGMIDKHAEAEESQEQAPKGGRIL